MEHLQQVLFPFSRVPKGSFIVLYGAGDVGQIFYRQLEKTGYCRVAAWMDKRFAGMKDLLFPLADPDSIADLSYDYVIIAVGTPNISEEIAIRLVRFGVPQEKIIHAHDCILGFTLCHPSDAGVMDESERDKAFVRLLAASIGVRSSEPGNIEVSGGAVSRPAGRVYKIGMVGTGLISSHMADAVARRIGNAYVHAVVSRSREKAVAFATRHGIPNAYGSCEALANDPEVDLVYIATPDHLHHSQTLFFLEHGKHVLCEKPFALNAKQAREMIAAARQRGLLLADGMWPCYMPMADTLRNIVQTGVLGKVATLTGNLYYIGNPQAARSGVFLSSGIYLLSLAVMLLGRDIRRIVPSSMIAHSGIDEQSCVTLFYDDSMAVLTCGMKAGSDRRAYLYGDKAFAVIDNANEYKSVDIYSVSQKSNIPNTLIVSHSMQSGYDHEIRACLAAIERGDCEPAERPHEETLCVMDVMDAVHGALGISY